MIRKQEDALAEEWGTNMSYGRVVNREQGNITFPAHASLHMSDWQTAMLGAAAEEQLHGAGGIPGRRKRCRRGCDTDDTAYHIVSSCLTPEYNARHDIVVWWVLRAILRATGAPEDTILDLTFGKATLAAEYPWGDRQVRIRAGMKIYTEARLLHNKPDITLILDNPPRVYILEVAISHIQNIRNQERLKRVWGITR